MWIVVGTVKHDIIANFAYTIQQSCSSRSIHILTFLV